MAIFSGHKVVGYGNITILVMATPFRHRDIHIFLIFIREARLCYIVVGVAKPKIARDQLSLLLLKNLKILFLIIS